MARKKSPPRPSRSTSPRSPSPSRSASAGTRTEEDHADNHYQIDLLDDTLDGGGVSQIRFCGKKAYAFNNVVNLRLLLGGSQFYLVERLGSTSALADAASDAASEAGSDWFQLCESEGLPTGCFRVREGGEYWVANGDVVTEEGQSDVSAAVGVAPESKAAEPAPRTSKVQETLARTQRPKNKPAALSPIPDVTPAEPEQSVLEMIMADEKAAVAVAATPESSQKKATSHKKRVREVASASPPQRTQDEQPVAPAAPVVEDDDEVVKPDKSSKKSKSKKVDKRRRAEEPDDEEAGASTTTAVAGTVPSPSSSPPPPQPLPARAGSDPKRTAAATASASRVLSSGASDIPADERHRHDAEEAARQFATGAFLTPPSSPPARAAQAPTPTSQPRTQATAAEAADPLLEAALEAEKKHKKDKKDKKDKKHKKDKKDKKQRDAESVSNAGEAHAAKEADDDDDDDGARARYKKEKKEKKARKKREREAATDETGDGDVTEAAPPQSGTATETEQPATEKKSKRSKKETSGHAQPSGGVSASQSPSQREAREGTTQSPARVADSPALRPPPAMPSPPLSGTKKRASTPRSRPTTTTTTVTMTGTQTSPAIKATTVNTRGSGAARSPQHRSQHSPEPVYSNAPSRSPHAERSPGLVLAPSPPLASPALGFTPVVNSLAEEFSLDNHSLSSFTTDSEYLYE